MHRVCLPLLVAFELSASPFYLRIQNSNESVLLSWPGSLVSTSGATVYPMFQLEQSSDLRNWSVLSSDLRVTGSSPSMEFFLSPNQANAFFRVFAQLPERQAYALAQGGAEVFGYTRAFERELQRLGQIPVPNFAALYPGPANHLPGINWDPTAAQYWNLFDTDPAINNVGLQPTNHGYRMYDFRLNNAELAILRRSGFVVTKRLAQPHFSEAFYRIWNDDLPVFVSADALLHAWHRSYENMLIELELYWFTKVIGEILDAMAGQIAAVQTEAPTSVFHGSLLNADYFIAVARSLLANTQKPSALGQDSRVQQTLEAIAAEQYQCFQPFGQERFVDFSQFKPRGHYESKYALQLYFKTLMWLGRMDLRVGGKDTDCNGLPYQISPNQLGTAIVLTRLLELSGKFAKWHAMDKMLETFVGWSDSLNFTQLSDLLHSSGINTLADVPTSEALVVLQERIETGELGVQNIRGDAISYKLGPSSLSLPRSFAFMGQRFVLDSWALSKVSSPAISWVVNGETNQVHRRVVSGLDVAFSVFQNNHVAANIIDRINDTTACTSTDHMIRWRDGRFDQHNLAAARSVIDQQSPSAWEGNIYMGWLATLRALSDPTTGAQYPDAMRTRPWAMRTLNTQLASWTQLRHDTLLYSKPTYTDPGLCTYPDGYVEPRVDFWRRFEQMARRTAALIHATPYEGSVFDFNREIRLADLQTAQTNFLNLFADRLRTLGDIAQHELTHGRLTPEHVAFLDGMMQNNGMGYSNTRSFNGWYPKLYYKSPAHGDPSGTWDREYGSQKYDPLIVDVHNDVPRQDIYEDGQMMADPGGILHEAVGAVDLLYVVINFGPQHVMYAGPVMSHYEFETDFPTGKSDSEWEADIQAGRAPAPPPWTGNYLVP